MIPFPPIEEQERIVSEIKQWFSFIDILDDGKADLNIIIQKTKSKIINLAIHGTLVPQDPNDEPAIELLKRINPKFIPCDNAHCPYEILDNWQWVFFPSVFEAISSKPYQILQSEINDKGETPVISQSSNYIEGYSDKDDSVFINENAVLIFGDHTRNLKYVDFNFIVGADGVKILKPLIDARYAYYSLLPIIETMRDRGYARHFSVLSKSLIPIAPLAEQQRIVVKIEELFAVLDSIKDSL